MKFSIKDCFSKCEEISSLNAHLLKKSLMENFIFCAVRIVCSLVVLFSTFSARLSTLSTRLSIHLFLPSACLSTGNICNIHW